MQPETANKKLPIIILCTLCLVLTGGGIYLLTENNKYNKKFSQLDNISTECITELKESGITGLTINETKTPVSKKTQTLDTEFCTEETQLCVKRPGSWMVSTGAFKHTDANGKYIQESTFFNQFGAPVLNIVNKVTGLGSGPCEGNPDDIKLTVLDTYDLGIKDHYSNENLYAVKAYYQKKDDTFFTPVVTITDAKALKTTKAATNHNYCDIYFADEFFNTGEQITFQVNIPKGSPAEKKGFFFREESAIKDWLENSDGATIYEMLKTAYIKK